MAIITTINSKDWTKTTFAIMDAELEAIGAKTTTKDKVNQPTSSLYVAYPFRNHNKPVYDFQIVDSNGYSFGNEHSYLYRMADGETHPLIKKFAFGNYYVETSRAIYIG